MTTFYKLTDANGRTYGGTQWGPGVSHSGTGEGPLCNRGWIHGYSHPLLAVLHNPIHANFIDPILWRCEGSGKMLDDHGVKLGYEHCTTIETMPLPVVTIEQRVRYAILCALEVHDAPDFVAWALRWLDGSERSAAAAMAARAAAWAAMAARAAAWAAEAAEEAAEARAAEEGAARAARAAAWAAWTAAKNKPLDFIVIAKRAMEGV